MEVLEFELCLYDSCCFHSRPQNILCFGDHGQKLSHFFSLRSFETHMDWHHLQYYIHIKHTSSNFCDLLSGSVVGGGDSVECIEVILGAVVQLVLPRPGIVFAFVLVIVYASFSWYHRYLRKQA